MRYEKCVEELKLQLLSLGFPNGLEPDLRSKICFQPEKFVLRHKVIKESDVVEFVLQFELLRNEKYTCKFYEAILRKKIVLDNSIIHEVDIEQLDRKMQLVNWNISTDQGDEENIDAITTQLRQLESTEEGKNIAAVLKLKYWSGTVVEDLIPHSTTLKSKYEISQRFYFFDGEGQITVEEAYRFLCNRWLEKQMQLRRKQEPAPAEQESSSSGETLNRKVSLLPKKKKRTG